MNRLLLAALALFNGTPAMAQELNSSPYDTREVTVEPVERIEVNGAFKVMVFSTDGEARVTFHGPAEMIADAEATVIDGTLTIAYRDGKPWSWNAGSGTNVVIKLPRISSVKTVGPADVSVYRPASDEFAASTTGAGRIEVSDIAARNVAAAVGGAGTIKLEGTSLAAQYSNGGAGSIEAKRLRSARAEIAIGGAGSIYADVSESATVAKNGAGSVEIVGGATCTVSPPGARGVECR